MRIIDQLVYKITADTKDAEKGLDTTGKKFDGVGKIAKVAMGAVTVGAVLKVVKSLGDLAVQSTVVLDRVDKMSQKIGMSRQGFQEWDYILAQTGANVDGLQMSMKTLATQADAVIQGSSEATRMFKELGVEVTDLNGNMKDQEALFSEVFLALSDMEDETTRTAYASRLLGRSATELAPAMNQGAQEIEHLRGEAHRLGLVYEDELIDKGVRLGDNILALRRSFEALKTRAIAPVVGVLVSVTDRMLGQYSASGALEGALDKVKTATERYKKAQEDAKADTNALTEAIEKQALAQLKASFEELLTSWTKARGELQGWEEDLVSNEAEQDRMNENLEKMQTRLNSLTSGTKLARISLEEFERIGLNDALVEIRKSFGDTIEEVESYLFINEQVTNLWGDMKSTKEDLLDTELKHLAIMGKIETSELTQDQLVRNIAEAYLLGNTELLGYIKNHTALYDAVKKQIEAIELQKWATEEARKEIERLGLTTLRATQSAIVRREAMDTSSMSAKRLAVHVEALNFLYRQESEMLAKQAQLTADLNEKEEARNQIMELSNKAVGQAVGYHEALGDAFDLNSELTSIYTTAIKDLIDSGLDPADDRVGELLDKLAALGSEVQELTEEVEDSTEAWQDALYMLTITGDQEAYLQTMIRLTEEALLDLRRNGVQPTEDAYIKLKEALDKFNDALDQQKNKVSENESAFSRWVKAQAEGLQMTQTYLSAVNSGFSQLGRLMEAQTEKRLAELDKQLQAELAFKGLLEETERERLQRELQEAKDKGDAELEYEKTIALKRLDVLEDYDEEKKKLQIEEAKRQKTLAIFQAIIDTASAVIRAMPNIPLMLLAGITGGVQLGVIQAQPLPSFDVGSMRIERDTQAIVHRNEMILPAPLAEQARREGVAIGPAGGSDIHLQVFMDSKPIIDTTVKGINSGRYGKIDARVVK